MANMDHQDQLFAGFTRVARSLCVMRPVFRESLLRLLLPDTELPATGSEELVEPGLAALSLDLEQQLAQEKIPAANPRRAPVYRPDLNVFKPWLIKQIVASFRAKDEAARAKEQAVRAKDEAAQTEDKTAQDGKLPSFEAYIFPEDLPKIVDDLWLFHRLVERSRAAERRGEEPILSKPQRDINRYDLNGLNTVTAPHRPKYPLAPADRAAAHKQFLTDQGGNGEAQLLATLPNGTEVIQLHSEAAAIAYGSPRWCTTWQPPRDNYFTKYADNLWLILATDGNRWQLHFREDQFKDNDDADIGLEQLFTAEPGLADALAQHVFDMLQPHEVYGLHIFGSLLKQAASSRQLCDALNRLPGASKTLSASIAEIAGNGLTCCEWDRDKITGAILDTSAKAQHWETDEVVEIAHAYFLTMIEGNGGDIAIKKFLDLSFQSPKRRERFSQADGIPAALKILHSQSAAHHKQVGQPNDIPVALEKTVRKPRRSILIQELNVVILLACATPEWQDCVSSHDVERIMLGLKNFQNMGYHFLYHDALQACARIPAWCKAVPVSRIRDTLGQTGDLNEPDVPMPQIRALLEQIEIAQQPVVPPTPLIAGIGCTAPVCR